MGSVLILEDDFILADDYASAFRSRGHEVTIVGTATEGIAHCKDTRVDVAIVDLFIQQGDGYIPDGGLSIISKLRHTPGLMTSQRVPIIAISGGALVQSNHDPLMSAQDMGATMTMQKPVDLLTLLSAAEGYMPAESSAE